MEDIIKYTCSCCGKIHEEWPSLAFDSPTGYNVLPESVKLEIGELTSDFCIIRHVEQTDRYIRATLTQKVIDHCQGLEYGLWVSLSEKNFQDYSDNYDNANHTTQYFAWLSNNIPEYDIIKDLPTTVFTKLGNQRPEIVPHKDFDHPFVRDYYNGITKVEAENRIRDMLKAIEERDTVKDSTKAWWKFW